MHRERTDQRREIAGKGDPLAFEERVERSLRPIRGGGSQELLRGFGARLLIGARDAPGRSSNRDMDDVLGLRLHASGAAGRVTPVGARRVEEEAALRETE